MRLIPFLCLIICILSRPVYGSYDTKDMASYAPFIRAAYTCPSGHIFRLKPSDQKPDLSGYYALHSGLTISQAVTTDTLELEPLSHLYNKRKLNELIAVDGEWRTAIRGKRKGASTTLITSEELETLSEHEKNKKKNPLKNLKIFICTAIANSYQSDVSFDKEKAVTKFLTSSQNATTLLLVPLKPRRKESHEDHWVSLVIKQWKEGTATKRIYFIADSGNDSPSLIHNKVLLALFKKIEGKEFTFKRTSIEPQENHPLSKFLPKHKESNFEESTCYKDIVEREAEWNAERKRILKPIPTLLGIATGALLVGSYIWLKKKRNASQTILTPPIQV